MRLRRVLPAVLLAFAAVAVAPPLSAYAGGPTSVLLVNPAMERTHSLYRTDSAYDQLSRAVSTETSGTAEQPPGSEPDGNAIRLTWLIHDVYIWRLDTVHVTRSDGVWIETVMTPTGEGDNVAPPIWHRPQDQKALTKLLTGLGLFGTDAGSSSAPPTPAAPGPSASPPPAATAAATATVPIVPLVLMSGLGGLVVGVAGSLLLRRPRRMAGPRVTLDG